MNTFGFFVSWRRNLPNTHLMRILAPISISRSRRAPRPFSESLMVKVKRFPFPSTIEYERVKSPSPSRQTKLMNCHGMLSSFSSVSITSSSVVGFKNVFSIILALYPLEVFFHSSYGTKSDFFTPQVGHDQSSGISVNSVPACIPLSASPRTGS